MATDATNQMRAMIAELMGSAGTQNPDERKTEKHEINRLKENVRDARNCRMFLLGTCPHEILEGTRYDIGQCRHRHDPALRADYSTLAKGNLIDFEDAALSNLQYFLRRHRTKIEQLAEQLKRVQEDMSTEVRTKANVVLNLNEEIGKKLAEVEKLGTEGKTDECEKTMREVEELKGQKKTAEFELRQATPSSLEQQQKLRVCEVCAAYIGINDNDQRLADHFGGKLHLGFLKLIENETKLKANVQAKEELENEERKKRFAEREKQNGSESSQPSSSSKQRSGSVRDSVEQSSSRRDRDSRRNDSSPPPPPATKTPLSPPVVVSRRKNDVNGREYRGRDDDIRRTNSDKHRDLPRHDDSDDDRSTKAPRYAANDRQRSSRGFGAKRYDDADRSRQRRSSSSSSSSTSSSEATRRNKTADSRRKGADSGDARNKIDKYRRDRQQRQKNADKNQRRYSSSSSASSSDAPRTSKLIPKRRQSSSSSSSGSSDSVSRRYRTHSKSDRPLTKSNHSDNSSTKRDDAGRRRDADAQSSSDDGRSKKMKTSRNGDDRAIKSDAGLKRDGGGDRSIKKRDESS